MQKWLLYDIPVKSYKMLNITMYMYDIIQNNSQRFGLSTIAICVYIYGPIKKPK